MQDVHFLTRRLSKWLLVLTMTTRWANKWSFLMLNTILSAKCNWWGEKIRNVRAKLKNVLAKEFSTLFLKIDFNHKLFCLSQVPSDEDFHIFYNIPPSMFRQFYESVPLLSYTNTHTGHIWIRKETSRYIYSKKKFFKKYYILKKNFYN